MTMHWPNEKEDVEACFEILKRECPDGILGPLIKNYELPENPDDPAAQVRVQLNPTVCSILRYFQEKYPVDGDVLGQEFVTKYLLSRTIVAPAN